MEKRSLPEMILGHRVVLRRHIADLAKDMYRVVDRDRQRLSQYLPWVPLIKSLDDEIGYIRNCTTAWDRCELFDYGIYIHEGSQFVGNIGVHEISWTDARCELGYWIDGQVEGRGYVSDSVRSLERTLFEFGFNRIEIFCDRRNSKSASIPRRLGYRLEGTLLEHSCDRGRYRDTLVFAKLKRDFDSKQFLPRKLEPVNADPKLSRLCEELQRVHNCHTVFYRSRSDAGLESTVADTASDFELVGVRESGDPTQVQRSESDSYTSILVYPQVAFQHVTERHLHLLGAKVLVQKDSFGENFLSELESFFQRGPQPLSMAEIDAKKSWAKGLLENIKRATPSAAYKRLWLSMALLEDYFLVRAKWYLGPERALLELKETNPTYHKKLEVLYQANNNEVSTELIAELIDLCYSV